MNARALAEPCVPFEECFFNIPFIVCYRSDPLLWSNDKRFAKNPKNRKKKKPSLSATLNSLVTTVGAGECIKIKAIMFSLCDTAFVAPRKLNPNGKAVFLYLWVSLSSISSFLFLLSILNEFHSIDYKHKCVCKHTHYQQKSYSQYGCCLTVSVCHF